MWTKLILFVISLHYIIPSSYHSTLIRLFRLTKFWLKEKFNDITKPIFLNKDDTHFKVDLIKLFL